MIYYFELLDSLGVWMYMKKLISSSSSIIDTAACDDMGKSSRAYAKGICTFTHISPALLLYLPL